MVSLIAFPMLLGTGWSGQRLHHCSMADIMETRVFCFVIC